jgi:hypothetical protein
MDLTAGERGRGRERGPTAGATAGVGEALEGGPTTGGGEALEGRHHNDSRSRPRSPVFSLWKDANGTVKKARNHQPQGRGAI